MLYFFKPRFGSTNGPTPIQIIGPWIVERERRKKRELEEREAKEAEETPTIDPEIEKVTEIALSTLKTEEPKYSLELEKELLEFAKLSLLIEKLYSELGREHERLELQAHQERQKQIELERIRIAKKILEMQEEEEALLFMLLN